MRIQHKTKLAAADAEPEMGTSVRPRSQPTRAASRISLILFLGSLSPISLVWLAGCGTPAAPQPPSLRLPQQVTDLTALRAGNTVTLHWTNPQKTTDHILIKGPFTAVLCRRAEGETACSPAAEATQQAGSAGIFTDALPPELKSGKVRQLIYQVELKNKAGRSAGKSNPAMVLAGAAPAPVAGLSAEVRASGVALYWAGNGGGPTAVRLHRRLLSPPSSASTKNKPQTGPQNGLKTSPQEAIDRDLLIESPATLAGGREGTLDSSARFGEIYEYTAQRVIRVNEPTSSNAPGQTTQLIELPGEISTPVRVDVADTFPPAVPEGLAAVLDEENHAIDLSWQPDTEEDLAGYIVYRQQANSSTAPQTANQNWTRISSAEPIPIPEFRDTSVIPAHSYRYAVTAIDLTGHESARSAEANEIVPPPAANP